VSGLQSLASETGLSKRSCAVMVVVVFVRCIIA